MAIYTGRNMPKEVGRTTMDSEVKDWLEDGPVLGSHEPIHVQRAAHDRKNKFLPDADLVSAGTLTKAQ